MPRLADSRNFLSTLTPKRAANTSRLLTSYYSARLIKKPMQRGLPLSIAVEPTTSCNLRCPQCPSGLRAFTRATGMLDEQLFRKIVDETASHLLYLTLYFQGEPYLHPRFNDLVRYATSKNIYTTTSTNAHFLSDAGAQATIESGLDRIIISMDGTTQETYSTYRVGGDIDRVLDGTRNLVQWKHKLKSRTPHIILQCIAFNQNQHQVEDMKRLGQELGVDKVKIKTAQVYDFENGHELIPTDGKRARYKKEGSTWRIKNRLLNHCWKLWHSCVITWDGDVVPCCFDKDAKYVMGNVKTQSLKEVWYGQPYQVFRRSLLKGRKEIDICKNCSEGTKVWI